MDLSSFGMASVPVITIIAYLVGMVFKLGIKADVVNRYIPVIVMVAGMVLGIAIFYMAPELLSVGDVFSAAAIGIVSGGAATAVDQAVKQFKAPKCE